MHGFAEPRLHEYDEYDVLTIADTILKLAKQSGLQLTSLQLTKLAILAQGFSLGMGGSRLFSEPIEAWKYGPNIPVLYRATKHWGRAPIPLDRISGPINVSPAVRALLLDLVEKYGSLDGISLSVLTHRNGTPWAEITSRTRSRRGARPAEIVEIPLVMLQKYYRKLVAAHAAQIPAEAAM